MSCITACVAARIAKRNRVERSCPQAHQRTVSTAFIAMSIFPELGIADPIPGLDTERGNLVWDAKGKDQVVTTMSLNTNDQIRGVAVRSSDEEAVMALEQRNCVIQSGTSDQPDQLGGIR